MPFCGTCGAPVEGRFCAKCGGAVAGTAGAAPAGPGAPVATSGAGLSDNAASGLCYAAGFITGIVFLVLEPYNRNRTIRFHAFQSIFFSVAWIVVRYALGILLLTFLHLFSFLFLLSLVSLGFFLVWLYVIISTFQGKTVVLPIIGPLAQQQK